MIPMKIGGLAEHQLEPGVDVARPVRSAHAQHGYQDHAQGRKPRKDGHHGGEERGQRLAGDQVVDFDRRLRAGVDQCEGHVRQEPGQCPHDEHGQQKQHCRVGQLVPYPLDGTQGPFDEARLVLFGLCHLFIRPTHNFELV